MDIFDAARAGDLKTVEAYLRLPELDLRDKNAHGFTALNCAVTACNRVDLDEQTAIALARRMEITKPWRELGSKSSMLS